MRYNVEEEEPEEADGFDDALGTPSSPNSPSPAASPAPVHGAKGGASPEKGRGAAGPGVVRVGVGEGGSLGLRGAAKRPDAVESIPLPAAAEAIKAAEVARAAMAAEEEPRKARGSCAECGSTVWSNQARMKASNGEYYHEACVQQLMAAVNAAKACAEAAEARAPVCEGARPGADENPQPGEQGGRLGNAGESSRSSLWVPERAVAGKPRGMAGSSGSWPAKGFVRRDSSNSNGGQPPPLDLQADERHAGMPVPTAPSWRDPGQPVEDDGVHGGGWGWGLGGIGNGGGGWMGGAAGDEPADVDDLDIGRGIAAFFGRASSNGGAGA